LISFPTTISPHNHYYRSPVLSARQLSFAIFLRSLAWIGKFPLLICFAPFDPCPALGNFFTWILVIHVGRNTSTVATTHTATRNSDTPPASPRELPTCHISDCKDWYTYYTSHNAPLTPLAVFSINQHYKNLHIQTQQLASYYSETLSYTSFPSPTTCMYKVSSSTFIIHV